jgi:hypothetical protein
MSGPSDWLLWPAVVQIALLLTNLVWNHSFFDITVRDGNLYGRRSTSCAAAPVVLVAIVMTLVIATRGIDLSVGAVAAISGSWASMHIISNGGGSVGVVLTAVAVALFDGASRRRVERFPGGGSRHPAHRGDPAADGCGPGPRAGDHCREDPRPAQVGLMLTSDSTSADPNSIGLFIELDAILAVVIGGTSLAGRFSLAGTLIGASIIETMDAFVLIAISARSTDVFKAWVVIVVCLLQCSRVRGWLLNVPRWGRGPSGRQEARPPGPPAVPDAAVPDSVDAPGTLPVKVTPS